MAQQAKQPTYLKITSDVALAPVVYCSICGAVVSQQTLHTAWHKKVG